MSTTERYASRLPVIGGLIRSIRDRRQRNQMVLAAVIAAVLCFFLWYFVLRHAPASSSGLAEEAETG